MSNNLRQAAGGLANSGCQLPEAERFIENRPDISLKIIKIFCNNRKYYNNHNQGSIYMQFNCGFYESR